MKIIVKTKVNNTIYEFEIDERNDIEALHKACVFGNTPSYCQCCKNDKNFKMESNKDKEGNTYINIVCGNCFAKSKLGQYKTGGYFWHKFEKYSKENKNEF